MRRKLGKGWGILVLLFWGGSAMAQSPVSDTAIVWQGFEHYWTYNHRWNRMGDYYLQQPEKTVNIHSSATGTGPDIGRYTSHYLKISTPDLWYHSDTVSLSLKGKEKQQIVNGKWVEIPIPDFDKEMSFTAFLNGFDMKANVNADKLEFFSLEIDSIVLKPSVRIHIKAAIDFNCQTLECPWFNNGVNYNLTVSYMVLASPKLESKELKINKSFSWDKKTTPTEISVPIIGYDSLTEFMVFSKIELSLSKAFHFAAIGFSLNNQNVKLTYLNWLPNMKKESAFPKYSKFAFGESGSGHFNVSLRKITLNSGGQYFVQRQRIEEVSNVWKGLNADSDDLKSVKVVELK